MKTFDNIEQIRQAVDRGDEVYWRNDSYRVINGSSGKAIVWREDNQYCGGHIDDDQPKDFYTKEEN